MLSDSERRLHPDLVKRVAGEAIVTADRYLAMVVRAFDYLPPVDVTFGDVVRAIVTSDHSLYPDELGLRGNLIEALRRRGIYPDAGNFVDRRRSGLARRTVVAHRRCSACAA